MTMVGNNTGKKQGRTWEGSLLPDSMAGSRTKVRKVWYTAGRSSAGRQGGASSAQPATAPHEHRPEPPDHHATSDDVMDHGYEQLVLWKELTVKHCATHSWSSGSSSWTLPPRTLDLDPTQRSRNSGRRRHRRPCWRLRCRRRSSRQIAATTMFCAGRPVLPPSSACAGGASPRATLAAACPAHRCGHHSPWLLNLGPLDSWSIRTETPTLSAGVR